jgi:hypothetical protein
MPSDGKSSHCLWQGELKSNLCVKCLSITFRGIVFYETLADEGRKNRN